MHGVILQQQQHPTGTTSPGMAGCDVASGGSRMAQALGVKTTHVLGVTFIISGLVMVALQIVCTAMATDYDQGTPLMVGAGIWCGIKVIICGILGCCAASYKTNGLVS
jgi:preprotein translocase subunit SecG